MRRDVVIFLKDGDKVLLAHKKRGLGQGRLNGPGGKVENGETFLEAIIRECEEEIGVSPIKPQKMAEIIFKEHHDKEPLELDVEVFVAEKWKGTPHETEEMIPNWYAINTLPLDKMWADDEYWLPLILKGQKVKAEFELDKNDVLIHKKVQKVKDFK